MTQGPHDHEKQNAEFERQVHVLGVSALAGTVAHFAASAVTDATALRFLISTVVAVVAAVVAYRRSR